MVEPMILRTVIFILNGFGIKVSNYKTRLTNLKVLSLMYIFEISDILFLIKNLSIISMSITISHSLPATQGHVVSNYNII